MIIGLAAKRLKRIGQWMTRQKGRVSHNLPNLRLGQGSSCWLQFGKSTAFPDGKVVETQSSDPDDQGEATQDREYHDDWWP
jgi:hypothetical protein